MRRQLTKLMLGLAVLAMGIGAVTASSTPGNMADLKAGVQAIADALAKGDEAGAQKLAADLAKTASVEDAMHLFAPKARKGYGVGTGVMAIEAKLTNFSKKAPPKADVAKDSDALIQMAYRTAAISDVVLKKAPEKDMGEKKVKDWTTWAENMKKGSLDLAEAVKEQDSAKIRTAAQKVTGSCASCHGVFRD